VDVTIGVSRLLQVGGDGLGQRRAATRRQAGVGLHHLLEEAAEPRLIRSNGLAEGRHGEGDGEQWSDRHAQHELSLRGIVALATASRPGIED
jgi:hypothetical protein